MPPSAERAGVQPSDENLLQRHISGSEAAFRELLDRHQQWLYGYLVNQTRCRETARDLFQEVFLRVARGAGGFRWGSTFATWLFAITTNVLRDHRRRQLRDRVRGLVTAAVSNATSGRLGTATAETEVARIEAVPDPRPGPDREYESRERLARVRDALAELPQKQRRVVLLVKVEGLSLQDAGKFLGFNVNTVKTLLRRGRLGLARRLAEGEGS